jgi:hypothetical protein
MSEDGVQSVVDQVKAGKLPAFQHVYATGEQREPSWSRSSLTWVIVGTLELKSPIHTLDMTAFRKVMNTNLAANFCNYLQFPLKQTSLIPIQLPTAPQCPTS